jgi:hypothetical protein
MTLRELITREDFDHITVYGKEGPSGPSRAFSSHNGLLLEDGKPCSWNRTIASIMRWSTPETPNAITITVKGTL